jgi:ubiquinone/menaquinone biosynthesis C-methylase UbiE
MTLQKDPEANERQALYKFVDFSQKRVLEIGCGEGRLTWQYGSRAQTITGVDLDRDSLRVGLVDRPLELKDKVSFSCADSQRLPFSKETFDLAILAWSL